MIQWLRKHLRPWSPEYTGKKVQGAGLKLVFGWPDPINQLTMELTKDQKEKIRQIISVFEVGRPQSDYSKVTVMKGDTGGLTFGAHQTTLNSGNLYELILAYLSRADAQYTELKNWLKPLKDKNQKLNRNKALHEVLRKSGADPVMQAVQDAFFDKVYWQPAEKWARKNGFQLPLSMAVVYDSFIHSGQVAMYLRNRFKEPVPTNGGNEKRWIKEYVSARDNWLRHHQNQLLHKTVYRTEAFQKMIEEGKWNLESPLRVRSFVL